MCDAVLQSAGYVTIRCQTARDAQRHLDTDRPDFLLVDLDLDWYDAGWDLLCLLQQARHRQLWAWPCGILARPFTREQLLTAVQAALTLAPLQRRAAGG